MKSHACTMVCFYFCRILRWDGVFGTTPLAIVFRRQAGL